VTNCADFVWSGPVDISDFKLRTVEEQFFFFFCPEVQTDGNLQNVNGVKRECVLSKHLSFFIPTLVSLLMHYMIYWMALNL